MTNALYDKGREAFLTGAINWLSDDIRVLLVDIADYTPDLATHEFLDDIPLAARVATSPSLTSKSANDGIADAADVTFSLVAGDVSEALVIYQHTGTESTSHLIAYMDVCLGLPITPNGGNVTLQFANTANKIFKL